MFIPEDISRRVSRVLAETLDVDEDDLMPNATLQGDLGAESLDFLDIMFQLEREFGINIPDDELFPQALLRGGCDVVQAGRLTERGLNELRARMPYADFSCFDHDRRLSSIADLLTVGLVARYMTWKLSQGAGAGANGIRADAVPHHSSLAHLQ
jgi:acyl carrier protein